MYSFHMTSLELTTAKADDGYMGVQFSIFSTFVYVWNFPGELEKHEGGFKKLLL